MKTRIFAGVILLIGILLSYNLLSLNNGKEVKKDFLLGLDLSGGSQLVYIADVSSVPEGDVKSSMESLRDVIERRINIFGVSEPEVRTEHSSFTDEDRLIVELPGVTDIDQAVAMIGETPVLEFKTQNPDLDETDKQDLLDELNKGNITTEEYLAAQYVPTDLTGKYLKRSVLNFDYNTGEPIVSLQFNEEGAQLFEQLTGDNIGDTIAIFLDGYPISEPRVNEKISGGEAVITGLFTPEEAKTLVGRLNSGALPLSISLESTTTVGATLGNDAINTGVKSGIIGLLFVIIFMILYYRLPGLIGSLALVFYTVIMLALFRFIPVTLTAAGVAGFIISIGLAIDANVLIFERMKEELRAGKDINEAISIGFKRAWSSIRDGNISTLISMVVLYIFSTSLVKGFALTFGLGTLVSMISAITISKTLLLALPKSASASARALFGNGFRK